LDFTEWALEIYFRKMRSDTLNVL